MLVSTALEAAEALVAALGLRWGEITVTVVDGRITILRQGTVLKREDLALLPAVESPQT